MGQERWERLSDTCRVLVTREHGFTTDTLLLAWFSLPRPGERCADLGTGCGTIPLVWRQRARAESIVGVELQGQAAGQARRSVEENGFAGEIAILRAGKIARRSEKSFPAFLVMGIALLLVSQAMLNMMVAVGLFPVTGQPLPLISKGGTSTLINCAYIGMILSVSRYVAEQEEKKAAEQQALEEAELAAKAERRQEIVAAMQEAITTLPSGDTAATSLPSEENSLSDDLKALLNAAGKREPEEEI